MKRAILLLALTCCAGVLFAQDVTMTGTWELYRVDTVGTYSLNEFRSGAPTSSLIDATLVLDAEGTVESDSQSLRFIGWTMESGFLSFQTPSGNSFYAVRDLSPDVLFLVSVTVTERNASVTQIEVNQSAHLILVRTNP